VAKNNFNFCRNYY